jgi:hypothetical protein
MADAKAEKEGKLNDDLEVIAAESTAAIKSVHGQETFGRKSVLRSAQMAT